MTRDEIITMAREAGFIKRRDAYCGFEGELERFADQVAAAERKKHQADIERWKGEAAKAEKWRGLALAKDGDGRTVQVLQVEARAEEREACAMVCAGISDAFFAKEEEEDAMCAAADCEAAIRARGAGTVGTSLIEELSATARQLDQALAVAAAEREACATLMAEMRAKSRNRLFRSALEIAEREIRARGEPKPHGGRSIIETMAAELVAKEQAQASRIANRIAKGQCPDCDGEGEIGGQFCGGYQACEKCLGTGKSGGNP